jgi:hypothetical protein
VSYLTGTQFSTLLIPQIQEYLMQIDPTYQPSQSNESTMPVARFDIRDSTIEEDPSNHSLMAIDRHESFCFIKRIAISPQELGDYQILKRYDCPSVRSCCGVCIQKQEADQWIAWLQFPYTGTVALSTLIDVLSPSEIHIIAFGIAKGLAFLHERGIVHGALTPSEIWLKERMEPLITGFPLSCRVRNQGIDKSASDDMLGFGWILCGMLIRRVARAGDWIPHGSYHQLIRQCCRRNAQDRMTAAEVAEFLKNQRFENDIGKEGIRAFRAYVHQFNEELE